jgi:hypothetical protein
MRLFHSANPNTQPWNTARVMLYGAALGVVAAGVKLFAPWSITRHTPAAIVEELIGAALAFALLCGLTAALRNAVMRRIVESETR